jgi:hypothetical protein
MLCAVLIPFFSTDILGLDGLHIGWWGWLFSLVGQGKFLGGSLPNQAVIE